MITVTTVFCKSGAQHEWDFPKGWQSLWLLIMSRFLFLWLFNVARHVTHVKVLAFRGIDHLNIL